jgi:hypothetical protein
LGGRGAEQDDQPGPPPWTVRGRIGADDRPREEITGEDEVQMHQALHAWLDHGQRKERREVQPKR